MPKNVAIAQERRDLGAVVVNASSSSGANLPYIHFVAGETMTCFDVPQASHQTFRLLRTSRATGKLSQPLAKCGVQGLTLITCHEFGLFDDLFIGSENNLLHGFLDWKIRWLDQSVHLF